MTNPPSELLTHRAFPDLAATLRSRAEGILRRWEQSVREVLPVAERLTLAQLRDHLPRVLEQMAETLEADEPTPMRDLIQVSQPHGEARFHEDYNVNELLIEYELLRRIITEEIADHFGRDLTTDEIIALNTGIDTAARRGVVRFVDYLTKKMGDADELHSRYVSFLNHELRGGLNGVLLMVEVLKRDLAKEARFAETISDLDSVRRTVLQTVGTMERFVFASRLGRGQYEPRYRVVEIEQLVRDLVAVESFQGKDRGVQFVVEVADRCALESDREMVRLILENLLSNTVKHAKAGGGQVRVTLKPRESGGCVIAVADDGPGIDAEVRGTLFSTFVGRTAGGKASARLGLAVSKQAANLIGAELYAESTPGVGSIFTLEVPNRR